MKRLRIAIRAGGGYLNTDEAGRTQRAAVTVLKPLYWSVIWTAAEAATMVVVRLSGLHYDPFTAGRYRWSTNRRRNMMATYRSIGIDNGALQDGYAIVECERALLKALYNEYWFSLAREVRMEVALFSLPIDLGTAATWFAESRRKSPPARSGRPPIVFDNLHNGVHFALTGPDLDEQIIRQRLGVQ